MLGHRSHNLIGVEHARFGKGNGEIIGDRPHLLYYYVGFQAIDPLHSQGVLGSNGGDGAGSMQSEHAERLKVRLDAGPASRVRAADGKHDLWHYEIFFSAAAAISSGSPYFCAIFNALR